MAEGRLPPAHHHNYAAVATPAGTAHAAGAAVAWAACVGGQMGAALQNKLRGGPWELLVRHAAAHVHPVAACPVGQLRAAIPPAPTAPLPCCFVSPTAAASYCHASEPFAKPRAMEASGLTTMGGIHTCRNCSTAMASAVQSEG